MFKVLATHWTLRGPDVVSSHLLFQNLWETVSQSVRPQKGDQFWNHRHHIVRSTHWFRTHPKRPEFAWRCCCQQTSSAQVLPGSPTISLTKGVLSASFRGLWSPQPHPCLLQTFLLHLACLNCSLAIGHLSCFHHAALMNTTRTHLDCRTLMWGVHQPSKARNLESALLGTCILLTPFNLE